MKELIDRYVSAYNSFDIEGMVVVLSSDVRFESYEGSQLTVATSGIDEFRRLAEWSKSLFSEREQRITELHFNQDSVDASISFRGQLAADLPNGTPAGTVIELQGQSKYFFSGGQISKIIDRS